MKKQHVDDIDSSADSFQETDEETSDISDDNSDGEELESNSDGEEFESNSDGEEFESNSVGGQFESDSDNHWSECSDEEFEADEDLNPDSDSESVGGSHKKALANLEKTDPEFYSFLKENDKKLLEFSSSDESEKGNESDEEIFKPPSELQVDSEDSDFEADDSKKRSGKVISLAKVAKWREDLINNPSVESISAAVEAFNAALCRVTGDDESELKVEGSGVFNAIVEMCVLHLQKSIFDFLKLNSTTDKHPEKAKKWVKIKTVVEKYFTDLFKLLGGVSSDSIISVILKHLHSCCGMIVYFHKLSKIALKHLTKLWSSGEETARVLAFLCILRLCTIKKSNILNSALKLLYIAYIRGSKFVSINTLPHINFMRRSLADLFALDPLLSYQHAFLYVRQLAIHLRNAVTLRKKESYQSVYNWQYINSLRLWVDLLCSSRDSAELRNLVFPVCQIIFGTIKLIPIAQYIPLRFHCIEMLIQIYKELSVFTPVLPFILDSLSCCDINKANKKASMKPFDFTFVLRLSKPAMTESGFPDAVLESTCNFLLQYGAEFSNSISFPDIFTPTLCQLKHMAKNCKIQKYVSKLKQVILKLEENSQFILNERCKINVSLTETERVKAFEEDMRLKGPPLQKYWDQVQKVNLKKKLRDVKALAEDKKKKSKEVKPIEEIEIPKIRKDIKRKRNSDEPAEFLPSDESDFEFPDILSETQEKSMKNKKKKTKTLEPDASLLPDEDDNMEDDVIEDLNINNF